MTFEVGVMHKRHPHLLADLAELLLVTSYDGLTEVSQSRLEALVKEIPVAPEELSAEEAQDEEHAVDQQESTDRHVEDCWSQLEYRQAVFGELYPFDIDGPLMSWKDPPRTAQQSLYCFLLVCSRLRSFQGMSGFAQRAARAFTHMSKIALQQLSGTECQVRVFDANSDDRHNHFGTNLRHAMKKLAEDLGAHHVVEEEIAKLPTSGDHGLDLVSVHAFADGAKGTLAIFGQCGAQETEWPTKTLEAHPLRFSGLFTMLNEPANLMFIPVSYRDSTGAWVVGHKLGGCLLVDRLRILNLVSERWEVAQADVEEKCYPVLQEVIGAAA